ncbi:alpha/beta hydrolase [Streptomyces sp. NBC_01317]|nr:alpha/beta hydrolase [Streptomyces sp. NBC_01317]
MDEPGAEELLTLFFESTETSRRAGEEWLGRVFTREKDRDGSPTDIPSREALYTAILDWSVPDESRLARLAHIVQPTLVANGDNDRVVPTENSYRLARLIPNAKLSIYPDAGHGFLSQYPAEFGAEVNAFLGR